MVLPLLWALLAGLALALSYVTGAVSFAWVGYVMLAVLVIGVVVARLGERGLEANRQLTRDRVFFGGQVEVEVAVQNRSRLPALWVYVAETLPAGLQMTGTRGRVGPLGGKGRFGFRYSLQGSRRGYYQIGPTVLRTGDLFGLSVRERPAKPASGLIVFPKIVAIRHPRFSSRRTGDARTRHRVLEDPIQVVGIRPYQRSDGLKRVHWRATAHTGQLQSKLYELSAQVDTVIAATLRRRDYAAAPTEAHEAVELAMVAAASIAQHVLDRRQRTGLLAVGWDPIGQSAQATVRLAPGRDREQLAAILSVLGRMSLGNSESLAGALNREREVLAWGSLVVAIAPAVDEELLRALLSLRTSGFDVNVVLVGRGAWLAAERAGLEAMGITATQVRSEADIRALGI
jgi:uncharacterized protein (DUF58 family)